MDAIAATPDGANGATTYLIDEIEVPPIIQPEMAGQMTGSFLLGEGKCTRTGTSVEAPAGFLQDARRSGPRFAYVELRLQQLPPYTGVPAKMVARPPDGDRRFGNIDMPPPSDLLDSIEVAVKRLKGRTLVVYSPPDFAKAVGSLRQALNP
jgi:hypothetical protein